MCNHPFDPQVYWESYFKDLELDDDRISERKPAAILESFCSEYLKKGATVLDLGCGDGRNAVYLVQQGFKVYGVDISAAAVALCIERFTRESLPGIFKEGTFDNIPFPDSIFTAVICIASLDHVCFQTARESIVEIWRVLEPGGIVLLTFDPPDMDEDRLQEAEILSDGTLKFIRGDQKGMLFRRYRDSEIRKLLVKQNVVSFCYTKNGTRIVICR